MKTKVCNKCGVVKTLNAFFTRENGKKIKTPCKMCMREYRLKRYAESSEYRKKENRRSLLWKRENKKRCIKYVRAWRKRNHEHVLKYGREYNALRTRDVRNLARWKVATAVKTGKLVRPLICSECGRKGKTEAHHEDYKKPLIVKWLCPECHKTKHTKEI